MNKEYEDKLKQCSYEELNELYSYIGKLKDKKRRCKRAKIYYQKNKEHLKEYHKEYYKKNCEKLKEYGRKYGKEHYHKRIMEEK